MGKDLTRLVGVTRSSYRDDIGIPVGETSSGVLRKKLSNTWAFELFLEQAEMIKLLCVVLMEPPATCGIHL